MDYTDELTSNILIPRSLSDSIRQDFKQSRQKGSSKGKRGQDPLRTQKQPASRNITQKEVDRIYKQNRIAQNIIEIPAEDATRQWVTFEDTQHDKELKDKLNELDAQSAFQRMMEYERLTGDGFVSIGAAENDGFDLEEPLAGNGRSLTDIEYLHPFSSRKVSEMQVNKDPFSAEYGQVEYFKLNKQGDMMERRVHHSRLLHMQTRTLEQEKNGIPLLETLYDPLTVLDSFAWSIGQIAYAMTFKVYQTPDLSFQDRQQLTGVTREMEKFFNTTSLAIIGQDEELEHKGPGGSLANIDHMAEFIWDYVAGSARMPKSHILGQQQGTITGGQYDSLNYYMRISGIQENYIRPELEYVIDLLHEAEDSGVGNGQTEPDYTLKFNPLWKLDQETDKEIRKLQAEVDDIYLTHGVVSPDEVREERFEKDAVMDKMHLSEQELAELADIVDGKYKEYIEQQKAKAGEQ